MNDDKTTAEYWINLVKEFPPVDALRILEDILKHRRCVADECAAAIARLEDWK